MAPDTPGSVVRSSRTPRSSRGAAAPASRALAVGLSLAATCTIVTALALEEPPADGSSTSLPTGAEVVPQDGSAGAPSSPVAGSDTPAVVAVPATAPGPSVQQVSQPVGTWAPAPAPAPAPTPGPTTGSTPTVAPAPAPTTPRVTTPPTTVARTRAS